MTKNWAIVIGINHYDHLQDLEYAGQDALRVQAFLQQELEFDKIFLFTDNSSDFRGKSTRPTLTNLLKILDEIFVKPFMGAGDNFWFFFSGHGIPHQGRDYLMPADGYPSNIERTAIAVDDIRDKLRHCGADNVIMILDACRKGSTKTGEGIGRQSAEAARQTGVISIFSCSPDQYSYEIAELQQGVFTYALLEGLSIRGKCATVERLIEYLSHRVPELVRKYKHDYQNPYNVIEPITKGHLILNRRYVTLTELAVLKNDAYQAETYHQDYDLAEQLWLRVLAAASGSDMDAIRAIQRIALNKDRKRSPTSASYTPQEIDDSPPDQTERSSSSDNIDGHKSPTSVSSTPQGAYDSPFSGNPLGYNSTTQASLPLQESAASSSDYSLPNTSIGYRELLATLIRDLEKLRSYSQTLWLSSSIQFQAINSVIKKVQSKSFSIVVVGEFMRGKTTFINALLGQDILPSDVMPCTATLNRVTYGVTPRVQIVYRDGREEEITIEQLSDYVTKLTPESENKAVHIKEAVFHYPAFYCQNNVDIIDTPGLNNDASMTEVTLSVLPHVDVAIMLIMAASTYAESEQKFLETKLLPNFLGRIIFVVTGIDRYNSPEDANKGTKYIRDRIKRLVLQRAKDQYGGNSPEYEAYKNKIGEIRIFGLSAYQALQAKQTGDRELLAKSRFPEFESALEKFLTHERGVVFFQVIINRLIASATEILSTLNLRQNASLTLSKQQQGDVNQMIMETLRILGNANRFSKQFQEIIDNDTNQASKPNASPECLDDNLRSECNADYTRLRELLKAQKWKEANQETEFMMLKVTGCEKDGWLDSSAIDCFPITDLRTIDQLWLKYTNGHFGFSVQKKIFKQVNQQEQNFFQMVNWPKASLHGGIFLEENHLQFTLETPEGHLPMVFGGEHGWIFSAL